MTEPKGNIVAEHNQHDNQHQVVLHCLNVVMCEDDGHWFAQGLEIDYAACGKNIEEAQSNFESGIVSTIHEHLKMFGSLKSFFKPAPAESWEPTYNKAFAVSGSSVHTIEDEKSEFHGLGDNFPFNAIAYKQAACAA